LIEIEKALVYLLEKLFKVLLTEYVDADLLKYLFNNHSKIDSRIARQVIK